MNAFKKIATTVAVTAGLMASHIAIFAPSAQAYDHGWRRGHHRPYAYQHSYRPHHAPYRQHRRDRTGDAVGAAVLGIGALIIGAAIADSARKSRHRYDD
jgi:hypothetical protein